MTYEDALETYTKARTAYHNALEAKSTTVGDNQIVAQDVDKLYAAMTRAEATMNSLSSTGIRVLKARWL